MGRLIFRAGSKGFQAGDVYLIEHLETTVGRAIDNDIVVVDERASRYHLKITGDAVGGYVLEDLGSRNGTFVEGERVSGPRTLENGDVLAIPGLVCTFQAADSTETVVDEPFAALVVDVRAATASLKGEALNLTAKEFLMLATLYDRRGDLCRKSELAEQVWPELQGDVGDDSIEQVISRLRRKLHDDSRQPRYLLTVRGLGYRLLLA